MTLNDTLLQGVAYFWIVSVSKISALFIFGISISLNLYGQLDSTLLAELDSLYSIDKSTLVDSAKAGLHTRIAQIYSYKRVDSCITHRNLSAKFYKKVGDSLRYYRQLLETTEQYYIKGDIATSLRVCYKIESYCLSENYTPYLANVYNAIGNNLKRQGDWEKAIGFYEKSKHYSIQHNDNWRYSWVMYNLTICNWKLGRLDEAFEYAKRARRWIKNYVVESNGLIDGTYSMIKYDLGSKDSVEFYLKNGLWYTIKMKGASHRYNAGILNQISEYYLRENVLDSSLKYGRWAFKLSSKIPVVLQKEQAARYLAAAFERLNEVDSALYYQKHVSDIEYQLARQNNFNEIKHLNTKLQGVRHKAELEEEKARKTKWILIGLGSILIIILFLILLVSIKRQNKLKAEAQSIRLQLLQKENNDKDRMLQNTMLELVKSNNGFSKLMQSIDELTTEMNPIAKKKARSLLLEYKGNLQEDTWRKFNLEFENANANFYNVLKKAATGITESELRIAAMHVSGLSNKEIASVTGQALRSIHTHKSNLRKKLEVADDAELTKILENLQEI